MGVATLGKCPLYKFKVGDIISLTIKLPMPYLYLYDLIVDIKHDEYALKVCLSDHSSYMTFTSIKICEELHSLYTSSMEG